MKMTNNLVLEMVAQRFKVMGEPNRLRLLNLLQGGESNVSELIEKSGLKQAHVSKILNSLAQEGIIGRKRDGNQVYYFIKDSSIFELCQIVCDNIENKMREQAKSLG